MTLNRKSVALLAFTFVSLTAACSSDSGVESGPTTEASADLVDSTVPATAGPPEVSIARSRFEPREIVIAAGETVSFINTDPFAHTVTARDDSALQFESGDMGQDAVFDVEFDEVGTFAYYCRIHPTMRATVVVQ